MLIPIRSSQFKRDVRLALKRGKDMHKLRVLIALLVMQTPLPETYLDHPLKGAWNGHREAHLEPDWLLAYRIVGEELHLTRSGTHAELFGE
ncbi:MAG: type II toxin-antitoxin system YafQ family toxin [Deltaproteobacteria bacterium]|jgi:mRNA interferase YafQ|nr:type II toxin-antitoxin system YafQ family toxin [Deltaproteobacteria bacterium]